MIFYQCCRVMSLQTVFALSTAPYRSAIAVVRISGPESLQLLSSLSGRDFHKLQPRTFYKVDLQCPFTKSLLDKCLVSFFNSPNSYTGENISELYLHGGVSVIRDVYECLGRFDYLREAEPGEFTKRAFWNGKLDLTEVEAVGDLINAESSSQRLLALRQLGGNLSSQYLKWRTALLEAVAHVEAFIDFGEDELLDSQIIDSNIKFVHLLLQDVKKHLSDSKSGEKLRSGIQVTLVGRPNSGKSSLMNLISRRKASIVTSIPGTTRDVIETSIDLNGYPIILSDTAGLRESSDIIESEGINRAKALIRNSDIIVCLVDVTEALTWQNPFDFISTCVLEALINVNSTVDQDGSTSDIELIVLLNKCDVIDTNCNSLCKLEKEITVLDSKKARIIMVSCTDNQNIEQFTDHLLSIVKGFCDHALTHPTITQARHRLLLREAVDHLEQFDLMCKVDLCIAAHKLRSAIRCLGKISGHVSSEEIYDVIFSRFCIGK